MLKLVHCGGSKALFSYTSNSYHPNEVLKVIVGSVPPDNYQRSLRIFNCYRKQILDNEEVRRKY